MEDWLATSCSPQRDEVLDAAAGEVESTSDNDDDDNDDSTIVSLLPPFHQVVQGPADAFHRCVWCSRPHPNRSAMVMHALQKCSYGPRIAGTVGVGTEEQLQSTMNRRCEELLALNHPIPDYSASAGNAVRYPLVPVEQGAPSVPHQCVWCRLPLESRWSMVRHALQQCPFGPMDRKADSVLALLDEMHRRRATLFPAAGAPCGGVEALCGDDSQMAPFVTRGCRNWPRMGAVLAGAVAGEELGRAQMFVHRGSAHSVLVWCKCSCCSRQMGALPSLFKLGRYYPDARKPLWVPVKVRVFYAPAHLTTEEIGLLSATEADVPSSNSCYGAALQGRLEELKRQSHVVDYAVDFFEHNFEPRHQWDRLVQVVATRYHPRSLGALLASHGPQLTDANRWELIRATFRAVVAEPFPHGLISPASFFIAAGDLETNTFDVRLQGFEEALLVPVRQHPLELMGWISPETSPTSDAPTFAGDAWSLGLVLYEVWLSGRGGIPRPTKQNPLLWEDAAPRQLDEPVGPNNIRQAVYWSALKMRRDGKNSASLFTWPAHVTSQFCWPTIEPLLRMDPTARFTAAGARGRLQLLDRPAFARFVAASKDPAGNAVLRCITQSEVSHGDGSLARAIEAFGQLKEGGGDAIEFARLLAKHAAPLASFQRALDAVRLFVLPTGDVAFNVGPARLSSLPA